MASTQQESNQINQQANKKSTKVFILDFLSGGTAGIISKTISAPIERVKLILQTETINKSVTKKYNGMVDCFSRTIKEEGVLSMWRGNWANVVRYFPTQALNFSFKEYTSNLVNVKEAKKKSHTQFMLRSILAGGLAGCMTVCFVYPLDFARTMLAVDMGSQKRQFNGLFDCISKVYQKEGVQGVYRGFNSCLFGIFVYRGLYFGIYDSGKSIFMTPEREKSFFLRWVFAQAVVIFSETISYPTDTIKRQMMMQSANKNITYKNSMDCFYKIVEKDGYQGLMKGNFSNIVRSFGSSLCLVLFDEIQKFSKQYH